MKHIRTCFHTLLDPGLDFRVRLFNILAIGGMAVSLIMVFCSLFMGAWPNVCLNFLLALVSGGLFLYSVSQRSLSALLSHHDCADFSHLFPGHVFYERRTSGQECLCFSYLPSFLRF